MNRRNLQDTLENGGCRYLPSYHLNRRRSCPTRSVLPTVKFMATLGVPTVTVLTRFLLFNYFKVALSQVQRKLNVSSKYKLFQ